MDLQDRLKSENISIHVAATGAGAGIQSMLWETPGCSTYLSGASFPYATEETIELLGFTPEHFVSEEMAIDLASAAYMKAYKFGGKNPVGVGLTASVASEKEHRGDHRVFTCVITNDKVLSKGWTLTKGTGQYKRIHDGQYADMTAFKILNSILPGEEGSAHPATEAMDQTALAKERFFKHPFFLANGQRLSEIPHNDKAYYPYHPYALMPGAFNPPHEGHFGTADAMLRDHGRSVIFEVTAEPPHKNFLSIQELLQRAKLLQGRDRIFTRKEPLYLDKARSFSGISLVVGADAMLRMLDPKWGVETQTLLNELNTLHTKIYIAGRKVDDKFITANDIEKTLTPNQAALFHYLTQSVSGHWDISSTELRNKLL